MNLEQVRDRSGIQGFTSIPGCGCMSARVLDLVEVHRVTCDESRQRDGDPSQLLLASGLCLLAAKKLL